MGSFDASSGEIEVKLDGAPVVIPPERSSFTGIRSYLESLALQRQRILCSLTVDGEPANLTQPRHGSAEFAQVEAETMDLNEVPFQLLKAALQQAAAVRARLQTAVELVLINDGRRARELWWNLSTALKEPLLTLSLLPDNICGAENGRASLMQLRKWQLEQLGGVIREVDEACHTEDTAVLAEALEQRVLPWLEKLHEFLLMWHDMIAADPAAACRPS